MNIMKAVLLFWFVGDAMVSLMWEGLADRTDLAKATTCLIDGLMVYGILRFL